MSTMEEYINQMESAYKFKTQHKRKNPRYKGARLIINEETRRLNSLNKQPTTTYFTISAPPSIKPLKTYCDITGLPTNYKSPHNQIRYLNKECYEIVKNMPSGVDQQYLSLRGANVVLDRKSVV